MSNSRAWWREPTKAQWLAFTAAWSGWVLDAFDFTIFMLVMPQIAKDFGVPNLATAGSITLTLLARLLGGVIAGAAADKWGRKLPLMLSIVWFAACDGAVSIAPTFTWILILRTLFGLGMGAEWTSGTTLAMENWPKSSRGIASGILQGSWAIGYLLAAGASAIVLPIWGWRGLFVCAAMPAILVLPIRLWINEGDEWIEARERERAAKQAWFRPRDLPKLAWACAAMGLGLGVYYALAGMYPTFLRQDLAQSTSQVAWLVALFNVGMLAGSVVSGSFAAKKGPSAAIAVFALSSLLALPLYVGLAPSLLPVGAFLGGALGVGFCGVTPMLLTGMFEARVRARYVGIVYHVGAVLAAIVPPAIAALATSLHIRLGLSVGIVGGVCEIALVTVILAGRRFATVAMIAATTNEEPDFFATNDEAGSRASDGAIDVAAE